MTAGQLGEYKWLCEAWQLGQSRDRVFEVRMSDPVKQVMLAAYVTFEEGTS